MSITTQTAQRILVVWSFVALLIAVSVATALYNSRGWHVDRFTAVIEELLQIYIPILTIMAGFYFGGKRARRAAAPRASPDNFYFAGAWLFLWLAFPTVVLFALNYVEDALGLIELIHPVGQGLTTLILGFYYAKSL